MTVMLSQSSEADVLAAALSAGALRPEFQPIVDLYTGELVAVEALARWPGIPGADPGTVFAAAASCGATARLDWACRIAAIEAALDGDLDPSTALFVNVESATLGQDAPREYQGLIRRAQGRLRMVLELTERDLMTNPAELLKLVGQARALGWGIAMDDVGADPASLALLPLVAPDVVKLDLSLIHATRATHQARTLLAVAAYAEETGAVLLAEGIEAEIHHERARALGARYGQGWLLGRPAPEVSRSKLGQLPPFNPPTTADPTPFSLIQDSPRLRRGTKQLLLDMTHALERRAVASEESAVLLSAFQFAQNFTAGTISRYSEIAEKLPLVAAFGEGMDARPAPGVRGADLRPEDPLTGEWTVVAIGAHYAGALIARDCGDDVADLDRRFDFVLTHDRNLVLRAGRSLMSRIAVDAATSG